MQLREQPNNKIKIGSKQFLYFSGTQYLGLAQHKRFQESVTGGVKKYGSSLGSSRHGHFGLDIYEKLEHKLAEFIGVEKVVTVSSGTIAGKLTGDYLKSTNQSISVAHDIHPCVGLVPEKSIHDFKNSIKHNSRALVNSINPLTALMVQPDLFPPTSLYVDDSHGIGVIGKKGGGINRTGNSSSIKLIFGSLSKAMGVVGGFIAGKSKEIETITKSALFGGASPMSPALAYALHVSFDLIQEQNALLKENMSYFKNNLKGSWGLNYNSQIPICLIPENCDEALYKNGCIVSSLRYPTAQDPLVNRIVLSSLHDKTDLDYLLNVLNKTLG